MDLLITTGLANINNDFKPIFPSIARATDSLRFSMFLTMSSLTRTMNPGACNEVVWCMHSWRGRVLTVHREEDTEAVRGMFPLLKYYKDDGHPVVNIHDLFLCSVFGVTCTLMFGTDLGCLSAGLPMVELRKIAKNGRLSGRKKKIAPRSVVDMVGCSRFDGEVHGQPNKGVAKTQKAACWL